METDFIYWRHTTPPGIKIEEISGGEDKSGRLWEMLARQVYSENGKDGYRAITHTASGAPLLDDEPVRISISHAGHLLVVASLPRTPEADLSVFSPRTALGVDTERADRAQVLAVRERFLDNSELPLVAAEDVVAHIIAWTCKEALYKAALTDGLDLRANIRIRRLPDPANGSEGEATVIMPSGENIPFQLFSYYSDDYIVTLAYTSRSATFKKTRP